MIIKVKKPPKVTTGNDVQEQESYVGILLRRVEQTRERPTIIIWYTMNTTILPNAETFIQNACLTERTKL